MDAIAFRTKVNYACAVASSYAVDFAGRGALLKSRIRRFNRVFDKAEALRERKNEIEMADSGGMLNIAQVLINDDMKLERAERKLAKAERRTERLAKKVWNIAPCTMLYAKIHPRAEKFAEKAKRASELVHDDLIFTLKVGSGISIAAGVIALAAGQVGVGAFALGIGVMLGAPVLLFRAMEREFSLKAKEYSELDKGMARVEKIIFKRE